MAVPERVLHPSFPYSFVSVKPSPKSAELLEIIWYLLTDMVVKSGLCCWKLEPRLGQTLAEI